MGLRASGPASAGAPGWPRSPSHRLPAADAPHHRRGLRSRHRPARRRSRAGELAGRRGRQARRGPRIRPAQAHPPASWQLLLGNWCQAPPSLLLHQPASWQPLQLPAPREHCPGRRHAGAHSTACGANDGSADEMKQAKCNLRVRGFTLTHTHVHVCRSMCARCSWPRRGCHYEPFHGQRHQLNCPSLVASAHRNARCGNLIVAPAHTTRFCCMPNCSAQPLPPPESSGT